MAKKEKIHLKFDEGLEAIDADLATAMEKLDEKNQEVDQILKTFEPPKPEASDSPAPTENNPASI